MSPFLFTGNAHLQHFKRAKQVDMAKWTVQTFGQVEEADVAKWTANKGTKPTARAKKP